MVYCAASLLVLVGPGSTDRWWRGLLRRLVVGLVLAYCVRFLQLAVLLWVTPDTQVLLHLNSAKYLNFALQFLWHFVSLLQLSTSAKVVQVRLYTLLDA